MNKRGDRPMRTIKVLVMDVDGTLTDGKLYIGENGEVMKAFHVKDGYGIRDLLPAYRVQPVVITGRTSEIVRKRCDELGIHYLYQGVKDKAACLAKFVEEMRLSYEEVACIGDDDNDLQIMGRCGLIGCPNDASERIKGIAHFISSRNGGDGAVREFIEWMAANGCFDEGHGCLQEQMDGPGAG